MPEIIRPHDYKDLITALAEIQPDQAVVYATSGPGIFGFQGAKLSGPENQVLQKLLWRLSDTKKIMFVQQRYFPKEYGGPYYDRWALGISPRVARFIARLNSHLSQKGNAT